MSIKSHLTALMIATGIGAAHAQVVIVNAQNAAASLSKEQIEQIFLGRSTSFPSGGSATPIDNAALRDAFYQNVTGKSGDQAKAHWAKIEFTGKGKAPQEAANGKAVAEHVAKNPAAIGYVDKADVGTGVKAVFTAH
jgi:ABC-type phosphate transport system substrate-binding protein